MAKRSYLICVDESAIDRSEHIIATYDVEVSSTTNLGKVAETIAYDPTIGTWSKVAGETDSLIENYSGKVLVPGRIWWDTAHVTALYSQEPVLANIFYAVKLKVPPEIEEYSNKALVLWFNTIWGLLTILISRQETRGRWSGLTMAQWRLLPVLDINSLDISILRRLAETFDRYASRTPRRIPEQFNSESPDPVRLRIDIEFLKALSPGLDEDRIKNELLKLYGHVNTALGLWIGS